MEQGKYQVYVIERLDDIQKKITTMCAAQAADKQKLDDHIDNHRKTWIYIGLMSSVISTGITGVSLLAVFLL